MRSSDSPYKVLFLDPGLFEETVCLVAPELAATLDFSTATALDKEHLTAQTRTRLQDQLTVLVADEADLSRLDEAGEWLVECDTGEALLARLKSAGGHLTANSSKGV